MDIVCGGTIWTDPVGDNIGKRSNERERERERERNS